MNEWGVVEVIVTLVGFVITIATLLIKLNTSITKLTVVVEALQQTIEKEHNDNNEAHKRIWEKVDQNSDSLQKIKVNVTKAENEIESIKNRIKEYHHL